MTEQNPIEGRLHAEALRVAQDPDTPEDQRELAACVLGLFRELNGYRETVRLEGVRCVYRSDINPEPCRQVHL